ncbi:MAG: hypothetical protein R3C28_03475 [Pirellulaceae bacterium]
MRFGSGSENVITFGVSEYSDAPEVDDNTQWAIAIRSGQRQQNAIVPRGDRLQIGIDFDATTNQAQVWYNNDGPQGESRTYFPDATLRPLPEGDMTAELSFGAVDGGIANGGLAAWSIWPHSVTGDFDGDGVLGVSDVDLLVRGFESSSFLLDVNSSDQVNDDDLDYWIHELANTYFGDSNLDGEFNSADLVNIFAAGEYEDAIDGNSTWATGWSGNGEFDSADLVLAFQDGGYELGPREAVRSVPEPIGSGVAVLFGFLIGWLVRRRRFVA